MSNSMQVTFSKTIIYCLAWRVLDLFVVGRALIKGKTEISQELTLLGANREFLYRQICNKLKTRTTSVILRFRGIVSRVTAKGNCKGV